MIPDLKLGRTIKENDRYSSYEATLNGKKVFAKKANSQNTALHLNFQIKNSQVVNDIGKDLFRAPQVLASSEDWLVMEWIDGNTLEASVKQKPNRAAKAVAEVVARFDAQPDEDTELRPIFTASGLTKRVEQRISESTRASACGLLAMALERFSKLQPSLKACLQDADVQPEHLFIDPAKKAKYVLIDSEHLQSHWPRRYDLANNYSKYWKRSNRAFAGEILNQYVKVGDSTANQIFEPLIACLIVRAFALHWEADYDPGALDTNMPRSQELLKACIEAQHLSDLLY